MMLRAKSADDKLLTLFLFPRKQDLTFHANCFSRRQFACNVISYFLEKNKKNLSKCHLLEILPSMLSVKLLADTQILLDIQRHLLFSAKKRLNDKVISGLVPNNPHINPF